MGVCPHDNGNGVPNPLGHQNNRVPKFDSMRWRKTAEEPPMEKNGNQYGDVLVLDASLEGFVTNKGWLYVKRAPDIYPIWMPIPKLPKEVEECLKYAP